MAQCDTCGNTYSRSFTVTMGSKSGTFDSFECAIHEMAPKCSHCHCRIIGHGVEASENIFCCDHCARSQTDHVRTKEMLHSQNISVDPDIISDPALSDDVGSDWTDEGGATPAGPATANPKNI